MALIVTKLILLAILSVMVAPQIFIQGQQQVPCAFFFGDSQFDNGNNNFLVTRAKVNYPPYGIDFPSGPTGRFSNGRNIPDFLAQSLGFAEPISPFATAKVSDILKGVNYASGVAGIRDESGVQEGDRISMNRQLLNHNITISRIRILLRSPTAANDYLKKCLYTINMGSNDYLNNYLMPRFYATSRIFTPDQFAEVLIQQFSQQLRVLYSDGARKVAVFGLGLLGCVPQLLSKYPRNGSPCVDSVNNIVQLFNNRLKPLIDNLNNMPDAQYTYINITSISLGDPAAIGITVANMSCCAVNSNTGQCVPYKVPCGNRNQYAFWDNYHPTEILNQATATRAYKALSPSDAYPVDIQRLVQQ